MSFEHVITSAAQLDELYRAPSELVAHKKTDRISEETADFIARSPLVFLATADGDGRVTVSPKGGAPGFVVVLDDHRLAIPDASGNNLIDGFRNLIVNPTIGLLFVVPGTGETLRVNGEAVVTTDPAIIDRVTTDASKRPKVAVGVEVEQVFLHCSKAFLRSQAWQPESWPERPDTRGMLRSHLADNDAASTLT